MRIFSLVLVLAIIGMSEIACSLAHYEREIAFYDWLKEDISPLMLKAVEYESLPLDSDSWREVYNFRQDQLEKGNTEVVLALDAALEYSKRDDANQSIREKLFDLLVKLDPNVASMPALQVLYLNLSEQPKRITCTTTSDMIIGNCINGTYNGRGSHDVIEHTKMGLINSGNEESNSHKNNSKVIKTRKGFMLSQEEIILPTDTGQGAQYIEINYTGTEISRVGLYSTAAPGNEFLLMKINIANHGYESFDVTPVRLKFILNNIEYEYSASTYSLDDIDLSILPRVTLRDGGAISGYVVFELLVPPTPMAGKLEYEMFLGENYQIIYNLLGSPNAGF